MLPPTEGDAQRGPFMMLESHPPEPCIQREPKFIWYCVPSRKSSSVRDPRGGSRSHPISHHSQQPISGIVLPKPALMDCRIRGSVSHRENTSTKGHSRSPTQLCMAATGHLGLLCSEPSMLKRRVTILIIRRRKSCCHPVGTRR